MVMTSMWMLRCCKEEVVTHATIVAGRVADSRVVGTVVEPETLAGSVADADTDGGITGNDPIDGVVAETAVQGEVHP